MLVVALFASRATDCVHSRGRTSRNLKLLNSFNPRLFLGHLLEENYVASAGSCVFLGRFSPCMTARRSTQRQVLIAGLATFLVPACIYGGARLRLWLKGDQEVNLRTPALTEVQVEEMRKEVDSLAAEREVVNRKIRQAESRSNASIGSTSQSS